MTLEGVEVKYSLAPPTSRKLTCGVLGEERPYVEVLDPVLAVEVMQGRALAESDAQDAISISLPARPTSEPVIAILSRDL